jgi:DNA mismatch repair protein MutL
VNEGDQEMKAVQRLPDALVDQIAAGEVVERPASVVKELVENAIDAQAERIRVEVRDGGAGLVAVTDDGHGMSAADATLAMERHATSKLRAMDELPGIRSFGFRGEALPAIASVSRFRMRTRERDAEEGFEIRIDHGIPGEVRAAGGPVGTRIEVADLFASVPARRKFLKREATEWGHIADWLARAALGLPGIHFDVMRDDRAALAWPATGDPLARIAAVLGEEAAGSLLMTERDHGDLAIRAFVSRPDAHRSTGSGIYLFVNDRPVRDKTMRHALLQVMRDVLPRGRFPTALLFVDVADGGVDVNVHPAKWEVRFADSQSVHRLVSTAVRDAMSSRSWLGDASTPSPGGAPDRRMPTTVRDLPAGSRSPGEGAGSPGDWLFAGQGTQAEAEEAVGDTASPPTRPFRFGELRLLGQLLGTYLLAEDKQGLVLIDQHAAHERVLYERLRARWLEGDSASQGLLVPLPVQLEASEREALLAESALTTRLGFEIDPFDGSTVAVRAVPELLAERDPAGLVRGLAEEILESGGGLEAMRAGTRILDAADHLFASMACHAARRAGDVLALPEQRSLIDSLDAIPWAPTCPHGRPVAVPMAQGEIERRFGRS